MRRELKQLRAQQRWRSNRVYACRSVVAWAFSLGIFYFCAFFSVVYALKCGKNETLVML